MTARTGKAGGVARFAQVAVALGALVATPTALAQPVRPNILIVFDTSGSMADNVWGQPRLDGSQICSGTGTDRRIYILKQAMLAALTQVGTDEANFGLASFPQVVNPNITPVCPSGYYTSINADTGIVRPDNAALPGCRISTQNATAPELTFGNWFRNGYRQSIVVDVTRPFNPAAGPVAADFDPPAANIVTIGSWLDGIETMVNGVHTNPEIRAGPQGSGTNGLPAGTTGGWGTPLGRSLHYARLYFDGFIKPTDPRPCRSNLVILVTDGGESCDPAPNVAPNTPAINFTTCENSGNPLYPELHPVPQACKLFRQTNVKTYVLTDTSLLAANDPIAAAGGTGTAIGVNLADTNAIKSELVRIIAEAVPPTETCNGLDDDCDGQTDEGDLPGVGGQCNCGGIVTAQQDGKGACKLGMNVCKGTSGIMCEGCVGPKTEICNKLDDNCNAQVDEGFNVGASCNNMQMGVCLRFGNLICKPDGSGVACDAMPVTAGSEICNGLDDDCNGQTDEGTLPGVGGTCGANVGECKEGKFKCMAGTLICDQTMNMGSAEICDAKDNNCNGQTDEGLGGGQCACAPHTLATLMTGECSPGNLVCKGREPLVCEGCVPPRMEICDGKDNDCDGMIDDGDDLCAKGRVCLQAKCELLCSSNEFPCPVGFACDTTTTPRICRSLKCQGVECPTGHICQEGDGACVDPCAGVTCAAPKQCNRGLCQDCRDLPSMCNAKQICIEGVCQKHPCADVSCPGNRYCDNGECINNCGGCDPGEQCMRGVCKPDPCAQVSCSLGQVCEPDTGECKTNLCRLKSCGNLTCVPLTGDCREDPCKTIRCPTDGCWQCVVAADGSPQCANTGDSCQPATVTTTISAKGGGGCSCNLSGKPATPGGALPWSVVALAFLFRRRRRRG